MLNDTGTGYVTLVASDVDSAIIAAKKYSAEKNGGSQIVVINVYRERV